MNELTAVPASSASYRCTMHGFPCSLEDRDAMAQRYCRRRPRQHGGRVPGYILHQTVQWPSIKILSVTTVDPAATMANWQ